MTYINRDNKGRFRKRVSTLFVLTMIALVAAVVLFSSHNQETIVIANEPVDIATQAKELAITMLHEKTQALEDEVLVDLAKCETGSVAEPDSTIILDTNGKMSLGRYQWQRESIQHYYGKLYNKEINRTEAIQIAIDTDRINDLTRDVLFNEPEGYRNWLNCANKLGLAQRIALINRISK